MKLLFWLVKNKADNSGLAPIYARITINGKLAEISTGIKIHPSKWVAKGNGYIKGSSDQVRLYNARLSDIRAKLDALYFDQERKGKPATAQLLKNLFTGKMRPSYNLQEVLQNLLEEQEENRQMAWGTLKTYFTRANNLTQFLHHINRTDILCEEIDTVFAKKYLRFLRNELGHNQDYARKNVLVLKKILNKAVELKIIPGNPLISFTVKKGRPKPIIALDEEELQKLTSHSFASKRLQQVTDLFIVQCCTGLAYAELSRLEQSHIGKGIDGNEWIFIERMKVDGAHCTIPLMPRAKQILEKYEYQLPQITNQKYNAYLKEIAEIVGIEKHLTTHVGRKTCGMLLLNQDVPIETVSRILGHSSIRITQSAYAKVMEKKIARDMRHIDF